MEEKNSIYYNIFKNTSDGMAIIENEKFIDCNEIAVNKFTL